MYLNNEKYFNRTIAMFTHFVQDIFNMLKIFCLKYKSKSLQKWFYCRDLPKVFKASGLRTSDCMFLSCHVRVSE